jgi:hypothetical protein
MKEELSKTEREEIIKLILENKKIFAVHQINSRKSLGLKASLEIVNEIERNYCSIREVLTEKPIMFSSIYATGVFQEGVKPYLDSCYLRSAIIWQPLKKDLKDGMNIYLSIYATNNSPDSLLLSQCLCTKPLDFTENLVDVNKINSRLLAKNFGQHIVDRIFALHKLDFSIYYCKLLS